MCKIAVIPKITVDTQKNAWKFAKAIAPLLSKGNNDGFGYMGLGSKGIFGERWLNNDDAFINRSIISISMKSVLNSYKGALSPKTEYNNFGQYSETITCLALHARMSTNTLGLENTHPFVSNNSALIHNGVIDNPDTSKMYTSSCDSETILSLYNENDVTHNISAIENVINSLDGYYACATITIDNNNNAYMDIFKCYRANLSAVYVKQLDSVVFCTDVSTVERACKLLKWKVGTIFKVKDYTLLRHNAKTGELVDSYTAEEPVELPVDDYRKSFGEVVESMSSWDDEQAIADIIKYGT